MPISDWSETRINELRAALAAKEAKIAEWKAVYEQCDASRDRLLELTTARESELADMTADYLRRHNEAADLAMEVIHLKEALEMIAGTRPCPDKLLGNADIARAALAAGQGTKT